MLGLVNWYNSPDPNLFLRDPLSELTRKERTALLVVATLALFIAHAGLVPREVTVLGIKLDTTERSACYVILAMIVAYFVVAFSLYCAVDYVAWLRSARGDLFAREYKRRSTEGGKQAHPLGTQAAVGKHVGDQYSTPVGLPSGLWSLRCLLDMALPVLLGAYAIVALLVTAVRTQP